MNDDLISREALKKHKVYSEGRTQGKWVVDEENLNETRAFFNDSRIINPDGKVFTMMQKNSPSAVNVTIKSRQICADLLTRID